MGFLLSGFVVKKEKMSTKYNILWSIQVDIRYGILNGETYCVIDALDKYEEPSFTMTHFKAIYLTERSPFLVWFVIIARLETS